MAVTLYDDDGNEIKLPSIKEVCPRCRGEGKHVNPAIDGNGITQSEMAELGDDFREDYLAGVYDVPCEECGGLRVIDAVDEERCDPELLKRWQDWQRDEAEYRAQVAAERRMGA